MKASMSPLSYLSVSKSPSLVSKKKIYTYNIFKNSNKNKSAFKKFFFFQRMNSKSTVHTLCGRQILLFIHCLCTVHGTHNHFIQKKILKMGPTVLFTHLKIILLQYFSVFSFNFQFSAVSKWTLSVKKFKERERWQAIVVAHDNKLMLVDWEYCRIDKLIWVRFFLLMERRVNLYLTSWNSWVG